MSISKNSQNLQLDKKRHTFTHLLAGAVKQMFPEAQFGVGPVVENGCYYDFILPRTLTPEDLEILENKIRTLLKQNLVMKRQEIGLNEAVVYFQNQNQPLKVELLNNFKETGTASLKEEEMRALSENEVIKFHLHNAIKSSHSKLVKMVDKIQDNTDKDNDWKVYYESLIIDLNQISINKDFVKRNINISEPIIPFEYSGEFEDEVVKNEKVNDIFDLIKFLKIQVCHPEADNLRLISNGSVKLYGAVTIGKSRFLTADDKTYECEYEDDIALFFGKAKVYVRRHLIEFVKQLLDVLEKSEINYFSPDSITLYRLEDETTGEDIFVDLCKGPHTTSTADLKDIGFKLDKFSGSYWRGDQTRNVQMQRIYALVFDTKTELDEFLTNR